MLIAEVESRNLFYIVAWISKADSVDEEKINRENYAEEIEPEGKEFNINYYFFLCFIGF
ncbi:hypothetical protein [Xenorhabdus cabanillasii]|uniref:hypothetical protein n=1 Tax=Xenorhabdus cabanillasii TaxID=351673 RepID=UPI0004B3A012|nr:hypothetical protein [Xenorhabdus cabanillasii]